LGLLIASGVEPAGMSDRRAGARLVAGLLPLLPTIRTIVADAGHESQKLTAEIKRPEGWRLLIVKRSEPASKLVGLNWIVERRFGWLGRHRRLSKGYESKVQTSETLIDRRHPAHAQPTRLLSGLLAHSPRRTRWRRAQ
jgi:putative transposase